MNLPESTLNLLLSGIMGIVGGLITIPINAYFSKQIKRDEILLQHELDGIAKTRELILQHELEMTRNGTGNEIAEIKAAVARLERRIGNE